jgi:deoxyxylulose-5-phosphate synthase
MVATVVSMTASASMTRASMDTRIASFNGLKACDRMAPRRNSLSVASSTVRARAGRSAVVVEARKVAVLGAGGGIGQPLSLLLKMNEKVTDLALYDIANVKGVAADLSHCNTPSKVRSNNLY